MATGPWVLYNTVPLYIGDATFNFSTDTWKVALFQATSNCATVTHTVLANLTNEVANGNGYTTGGQTLASVTWTGTSGTATFDAANPVWTASGGSITSRHAVIYKSGTANARVNPLLATSQLETTDVVVTDGNTLTLLIDVGGISQLAKV